MNTLVQDLRDSLRGLRQHRGFTAAVVSMFALGIGANSTMFGIIDRLLLRPPAHIIEADEVRRLMVERRNLRTGERSTSDFLAYPDFEDFRRLDVFDQVAAYSGRELTVGSGVDARRVDAKLATSNFFPLLGVTPELGRFFSREDDRVQALGTAVIGYELWQQAYGGDRSVLGESIDFGHGRYTIIGVAPPNFTGVGLSRVDLWLPLRTAQADIAGTAWQDRRTWYWLQVVSRLARGSTTQLAEAQATTVHRRGRTELIEQGRYDEQARVLAAPLIAARGPLAPSESAVALWLAGVSLVVLLIACANVANLLLARSVRRRREVGIWLALGMSRRRLLVRTGVEGLVLALIGGAVAVLLTLWGGGIVRNLLLPDIAWGESALSGRVLLVTAAAVIVAGLSTAAVPAMESFRYDIGGVLRSDSRTATRGASRTRTALTVGQIALSVVLLVGAGLFVRSLGHVESLDLGFDAEGVLFVQPIFESEDSEADRTAFFRTAAERLGRLPGVEYAAASMGLPFWSILGVDTWVPGRDSLPSLPGGRSIQAVGREYFSVLQMPILRGRGFRADDDAGSPGVVVVNETMAQTLWPGRNALGQCLVIIDENAPCARVVGVVADTRRFSILDEPPALQYYVPLEQGVLDGRPDGLLVRARDGEEGIPAAIRRELLALDSDLRYVQVRGYLELIDPRKRSWRLGASMFTLFGLLALAVAGIGLYSVLAFGIAQRRREVAIRSALGAPPARLIALVVGQSARLAGLGILVGLLVALITAPAIEPLLYRIAPADPTTFAAVALLLGAVALAASYIPARRATRVDPSAALRAE